MGASLSNISCCGIRDKGKDDKIPDLGKKNIIIKRSIAVQCDNQEVNNSKTLFDTFSPRSNVIFDQSQSHLNVITNGHMGNNGENLLDALSPISVNGHHQKNWSYQQPQAVQRQHTSSRTIDIQKTFLYDKTHKILDDVIEIGPTLARGATCKVKQAWAEYQEEDGTIVKDPIALKVYDKKSLTMNYAKSNNRQQVGFTQLDLVKQEITLWQQLEHENIIKIFTLYDQLQSDKMFLVMELGDYGPILEFDETNLKFKLNKQAYQVAKQKISPIIPVAKQNEEVAKWIFRQVAYGLLYLHDEMYISHRDIKPENILLKKQNEDSDDKIKIGDFTLAIEIPDDEFKIQGNFGGTLPFLAPECIGDNQPYYPRPVDVWAFGVSLFAYVTLKLPFYGEDQSTLLDSIQNNQWLQSSQSLSYDLRDLLKKIFVIEQNQRLTISEVLNHKWLK